MHVRCQVLPLCHGLTQLDQVGVSTGTIKELSRELGQLLLKAMNRSGRHTCTAYRYTSFSHQRYLMLRHNWTVAFIRSRSSGRLDAILRLWTDCVFRLDASDDVFVSTDPLQNLDYLFPRCFWFIVYPVLEHFRQLPGFIAGVLSINVSKNVSWNIQLDTELIPVYFFQLTDQVLQLWIVWVDAYIDTRDKIDSHSECTLYWLQYYKKPTAYLTLCSHNKYYGG